MGVIALMALLVAGAAALSASDWVEEWRLRRLSHEALETLAGERSWDPLVLFQVGLSRARRGDHASAAAALARAASADPSFARAHRALGREFMALDRLAEGEVALRRAAQLDPRDRLARRSLAELYRRAGAHAAAIATLEALRRERPEELETLFLLAECYGERYQPDRRLATLEQVVRRAPEVARYQTALGSAYLYYGRLEEAERCFRDAVRVAPGDAEARYRWGRSLVEQGDDAALARAARELETATRLRPEHANTWMAMGQLALRQDRPEAARTALEKALRLGGGEDRILLLLGQTLLRLGRTAQGRQTLTDYRRSTDRSRAIVQLENRLLNAPSDRAARLRLSRLYAVDGQPERAAYHRSLAQGGVATQRSETR